MSSRYLVFCGQVYYSVGGAFDLHSCHKDEEKAKETAKKLIGQSLETHNPNLDEDQQGYRDIEWSHVFDIEKQVIINSYGDEPLGSTAKMIP